MKVALIFPPQWDPRQPPLCVPTLAGVLKSKGHLVRAWDLNLYLYWQIFVSSMLSGETKDLIQEYLHPDSVKNYRRFAELSDAIECIINYGYNRSKNHQLYWDLLREGYSTNISKHWILAAKKPRKFPFFRKIRLALDEIILWKPEIVCISCISDTQIFGTLSIASEIRSRLPDARIVIGGHALRLRKNLLSKQHWLFDIVDAVCISHGEPTVTALAEGRGLCRIPNIIWSDSSKIFLPDGIELFKFDEFFEPDFSVLKMGFYLTPHIVIPIETARGCPWGRCSFCGHPEIGLKKGNAYTTRSMKSLLNEIRYHVSSGYTKFFFVDEAIPFDRFKEISYELSKMEGGLSWICYLRFERKHNLETFLQARKSGCRKVFLGLETGSERLLKLHRKGFCVDTAKRILQDATRADIAVHLFLITGFPDESGNDRKATYELLREILPLIDDFGFTYDIFPLAAELETPLFLYPTNFGAEGIKKPKKCDLAYRFNLISSNSSEKISNRYARVKIKSIIEKGLKGRDGLRHYDLSQDSTHLLLIEAHS